MKYVVNDMDDVHNWINSLYVNNKDMEYEEPLVDDIVKMI